MRLHYLTKDGKTSNIELSDKPVTIGRSADADVLILDEKASRVHCGIRFWDGEYFIKDLKSKNGTFVNEARVDNIHQLKRGDRIRVGTTLFIFEQEAGTGTDTALEAMQDAFKGGKGYSTILREIVHETDHEPLPESAEAPVEEVTVPNPPVEADDIDAAAAGIDRDADTPHAPVEKKGKAGNKKPPGPPRKRKPFQIRVKKPDDADSE